MQRLLLAEATALLRLQLGPVRSVMVAHVAAAAAAGAVLVAAAAMISKSRLSFEALL